MKKRIFSVIIIMIMASLPVFAADTTTLPIGQTYALDKLNNQEGDLYIAFLGGSITAGSGCSWTNIQYKDGGGSGYPRWTSQITKRYFQAKYPNKNVKEVNAGIPGTRSDFGLFRMKNQLIDKCGAEGPDVVFIEFAVNDKYLSLTNPTAVKQRMEGLIRQLATLPKQPVIIFVYTAAMDNTTTRFTPYLQSAQVHQQIADAYGIGSLNLCEYVAGGVDIEGNPIIWESGNEDSWTGDLIHPNDKGYTGYADWIKKQFEDHPEKYFKKLIWHKYPLNGYEFGSPDMVSQKSGRFKTSGSWKVDTTIEPYDYPDGVITTIQSGATLSFEFEGRSLGLYYPKGDIGNSASYVIDRGSSNPVTGTIDCGGGSSNWGTKGVMDVINTLSPGKHTITFTTNIPSESGKNTFGISYFLVDEEQPDPIVTEVTTNKVGTCISKTRITGSYNYCNAVQEEGNTKIQWMIGNTKNGTYEAITGGSKLNYTPSDAMIGKYLKIAVTPVDLAGNVGQTVYSDPILVVRPSVETAFSVDKVQYLKDNTPISAISSGEITSTTNVTNNLSVSQEVQLITAEYLISESGQKTLISCKKQEKEISAGTTENLSATLTVIGDDNHLVKTMVVASDNLEPLCTAAILTADAIVYIGVENQNGPLYTYQINEFGNKNE